MGYGLALLTTGLLRHGADPEAYPLVGAPRELAATYNPGRQAFRTWWSWGAVNSGDFAPVYEAAVRRAEGRPIYQPEELREHSASFVYTPFTAMLFAPWAERDAARRPSVEQVADAVSYLNHGLALFALVLLYPLVFGGGRPRLRDALPYGLACLAFFPLASALELTQAGVWIFFFLALAFHLASRKRYLASGLALAVGVSIKPHLVLVPLLALFVRGFPRQLLAGAWGGIAACGFASLAYAGWANAESYVNEVLPTLSSGYSYFRNQSFNGLLLRLFTDESPAVFNLAEPVRWIRLASTALGLSLVGLAFLSARAWSRSAVESRSVGREPDPLAPFAGLLAAAVLASPVCWMHHYILLLPSLAFAVGRLLRGQPSRPLHAALMLLALLLLGFYFDARGVGNGWPALLSGLEFYGALLALGVTLSLVSRDERPHAPSQPSPVAGEA